MIAFALTIFLSAAAQSAANDPFPVHTAAEVQTPSPLKDALSDKLKELSDGNQAIFHEDVTPIAAPYFPKGQSFADTKRVLAEQKLGPLRHFHGKGERADNPIYVSHTDLGNEMFSDVYVVLDFEYDGKTEQDMTLRKVSAYLQASSM